MGNGMNKVLPGLYIGNIRDSKDQEQLKANEITHIISIHDNAKQLYQDKKYLCIQASDSPDQNISQYFPQCNEFIHRARTNGGSVLIHCLAGVSRSATVAAAYIMSSTTLNARDAVKVIRTVRAIANPNFGFEKQLKNFERCRLGEERRRLRKKYPESDYDEDDKECHRLLGEFCSSFHDIGSKPSTTTSHQ
ncbi:dual specificity protein phosphatase 22-like [Centruroides sculpturatus]|uniref:dual specificity protein phosphatase 22-like n=1 Tax=Centruroides sculpturatus TaxID=218467 RepID=UPI000C6D885C|nr:dual specificity protein phosphatase 22-like [Centruroides sculpturatus]